MVERVSSRLTKKAVAKCLAKNLFTKLSAAYKSAQFANAKKEKTYRVYYCDICGGYHLTTKAFAKGVRK